MATSKILFMALAAILAGRPVDTIPVFTIVPNSDSGFDSFDRKVEVFDIPIYAAPGVDESKLLHVANVMAQYLDNDEDGQVDNQLVVREMQREHAFLVMWKNEFDMNSFIPPDNAVGQDLGNDETVPGWHTNGHAGTFDAALEEVWHLIANAGYAAVYPEIFGLDIGTGITGSMDIARGGFFLEVPPQYPDGAWFTYYDKTCDYECMGAEYFYWALTSLLGAQENRLDEIEDEWKLNTRTLVQTVDTRVYGLLTNSQYKLPSRLPDGTYKK